MNCEKCRAAAAEENLAEAMHAASDEVCGCESTSLSEHSPGPVEDTEELHFLLCDPGSVLSGGKINPAFLVPLDRGGLSTLRSLSSDQEFERALDELEATWASKCRSFYGVATFSVSGVRYIENERLCCAYDTGLSDRPHHADIIGPRLSAESKTKRELLEKRRYKALIDSGLNRVELADEFRGGFLAGRAGASGEKKLG